MVDTGGVQAAFDESSNLFGELVTRELQIIWEHSFQKVDENSGDGITSKFFDYSDTGITRSGPDVEVSEGGHIQSRERGDYGAGQPVIAGGAGSFNQAPAGDQDGYLGYYDRAAGIGYGAGYKYFDGTGPASEAGAQPYAFNEKNGEGREIVPQEDWNINKLNGEDGEGPAFDPTDGFTVRLPHACYGHSASIVAIGLKKDVDADFRNGHLRRESDAFEVYPVHVFTERGDTMWNEFDLPFVFETIGTEGNGFQLEATACHYEGETGRGVKRLNGEVWTPQKNGGSTISVPAFPDWTYVMSLRKRSGWETADITPYSVGVVADQNCELMLTTGATLSDTSYGLPEATSPTEAAAEYDLRTWDLQTESEKATDTTHTDVGEREAIEMVPANKQEPVPLETALADVVLSGQTPLSVFVRRATGNQTSIQLAELGNGGGF